MSLKILGFISGAVLSLYLIYTIVLKLPEPAQGLLAFSLGYTCPMLGYTLGMICEKIK